MTLLDFAYRPSRMATGLAAVLTAARAAWLGCLAGLADSRRARRTALLLGQLSDHELKDIGLTRSDLPRLARERPSG